MRKKTIVAITASILVLTVLTACSVPGLKIRFTTSGTNNEEVATSEETGNGDDATASDVIKYDDPSIIGYLPESKPELSEDFYTNMNYEYLKEIKLPEGYSNYGAFSETAQIAEDRTLSLLMENDLPSEYALVSDFFNMYMDTKSRNAAGFSSVIPYVEQIEAAENIEELNKTLYSDETIYNIANFWGWTVEVDMKDSTNNVICFVAPKLDLGDSAEYSEMTDYGEMIKTADDKFFVRILQKAGFDENRANEMASERFDLEKKMAQYLFDLETSYREDYIEMTYNPYTLSDLYELSGDYQFESICKLLKLDNNKLVILDQPEYFGHLSEIITEDNLEELKSYLIIDILAVAAQYTDDEAFAYFNDWNNEKVGSQGTKALEKRAYDFVCKCLPELVGQAYAQEYFSEAEKEDVEKIVYDLLDVYRNRLENIDWLSEETKKIAIEKLDNMSVCIGYPDELEYDYSDIETDLSSDLFSNYIMYIKWLAEKQREEAGKPVNKNAWGNMMAANVVNACYAPPMNGVYFPAAILMPPFYSKDASAASNMGGVGIIIGHEVTHAFDTAGSQYDKDGNLSNWWTEEDREAFSKKTKAVGERYARYEMVDGYRVNGDLTIGETVADLGGASAALQILENKEKDGETIDYKDFFETNAKVWERVFTKEERIRRLKTDPHAPEALRVNVNLTQFDKFYEVYDVKEGDAMYTAPEDRLKVW